MTHRITMPIVVALAICGCAHGKAGGSEMRSAGVGSNARLVKRVHFPTAGHRALSRDSEAIERNARWLAANPSAVVVLEGHCDERGPFDYNMELGDRRARWVMGRLMTMGVEPDRLVVLSKGEEAPLDDAHTSAAWRRNRRVEFIQR